jgi:hypothetical protein
LRCVIHARGLCERGFRADIHDSRALRREDFAARNRRVRREADALAIPRVGRKIDYAHDGGLRVESERLSANGKLHHTRGRGSTVLLQQSGKLFEVQHAN